MRATCKCQVLVAESDPSLLETMAANLEAAGCRVLTALDGEEALQMARRFHPQLLVMNYLLPVMSGADVLRATRSDPQTKEAGIIILTDADDEVIRIVCLELGADDCVSKPLNPRELALRARSVAQRCAAASVKCSPATVGSIDLDDAQHEVRVHGKTVTVTAVEYKLLQLLARQPGRAFSRAEILDAVHGPSFKVGTRTVDTHMTRLRIKLGPGGDQIETVRGFGYRLRPAR